MMTRGRATPVLGNLHIYARSHDRVTENCSLVVEKLKKRNMTSTLGRLESLLPNALSKIDNETPTTSTSFHDSCLPQASFCESGITKEMLADLRSSLSRLVSGPGRISNISTKELMMASQWMSIFECLSHERQPVSFWM